MGMNCKSRCGKFFFLAVLGIAALGWAVMALWNWLVPALFLGAREINYLQAMGLLVLSKILFGGFRCHGGWHGHCHPNRLDQMTLEEREKFKSGMRCWFGQCKQDAVEPKKQID